MSFWWRELRTPSLRLLLLALALAVGAVSSVGLFSDRLDRAFDRDATALVGGDLAVIADRPIGDQVSLKARALGLSSSSILSFPSMALAGEQAKLISLKVVDQAYPLRGTLRLASERLSQGEAASAAGLRDDEVWVDEALLAAFALPVGAQLQLGEATFNVTRVIAQEPDRPMAFANFAPRAMISQAGLKRSDLLQPGSRVSYKLLLAGTKGQESAVRDMSAWLKDHLDKGQRLDDVKSGRPEIRSTLERAEKFLSLAALLATLVASVGVALAAHHFAGQKHEQVALMKSIGYTPSQLRRTWGAGLLMMGLLGSLAGAVLGWLAHHALVALLDALVGVELPAAGAHPWGIALLMGLTLTLGFAGLPLFESLAASPISVLRQSRHSPAHRWLTAAAGIAALSLVCLLAAGQAVLAGLVLAGSLGVVGIFALLAWSLVRAGLWAFEQLSAMGSDWGVSVRFAWLSLSRRIGSTVLQGVALTVGLTALLLLSVLRSDLIDGWQKAVPADAPNRFAMNIQPEQKQAFEQALQSAQVSRPQLYPMVRGRLIAVNEQTISPDAYADDRAKRLLDREFNLSYTDALPEHNRISQGNWFTDQADEKPALSMEAGILKTLGLKLGDSLTFDVGGQVVNAAITSVREVEWDSMQVNFFVIFPTKLLKDMPQSWITAFYLPAGQQALGRELLGSFPNVTLIDTGLVIAQVRSTLNQVSRAVEFIFSFTVLAGALVMLSSLMGSHTQRLHEMGIMRALGASQSQVRTAVLLELVLIGLLAGLMSGLAAQAMGYAIAKVGFDFTYVMSPGLLMASIVLGVLTALLGGGWSVRRIIATPPLQVLRAV
jgi:putative ABC transport system permease protein